MKKKWIRTIATISLFIMLTPLFGCEPGDLETESDSAGTETGPSTVQSNDEKKLEDLASQLLNSQIFSENMTAASPSAIPGHLWLYRLGAQRRLLCRKHGNRRGIHPV